MNYAPITTEPTVILLPRTLAGTPEEPRLTLVCTADRQQYAVPVSDFSADGLYYRMALDLGAITTPGEYEYRLTDGDSLLASGLLRMGDAPELVTHTYDTAPKYEQFVA